MAYILKNKMLFEIYNDKGNRVFYTDNKNCLPSIEYINAMLNDGYKFRVDEKLISKRAIGELIKGAN